MTDPKPLLSADQLAAHDLLSELRTRIATQPLPYQHGVEASALESLVKIFELARAAMKKHPGCSAFARATTTMLNVDLRPVTAKWHRALAAGLLDSKDGANNFRIDLALLQRKLVAFSERLQMMAYGEILADERTPDVLDNNELAKCFRPVQFGLAETSEWAASINASEANDIRNRRDGAGINTAVGFDAVGLSLSGGGIRSATFCLGVVQVLAERSLMKHFDYLSTVSGGGYTGSFITARIGESADFRQIGRPLGPDTDAVKHLRQNAKYLSAIDLRHRWLMISGTIAGLLMNWMPLLFLLASCAFISTFVPLQFTPDVWASAAAISALITLVLLFFYGFGLRTGARVRTGGILLACGLSVALACVAIYVIELIYLRGESAVAISLPIGSALAILAVAGPVLALFLPVFRSPTFRNSILRVALLAAGSVVPLIAIASFYSLRKLAEPVWVASAAWWNPLPISDGAIILILVIAISGLFSLFALNINLTGPHKLYRDKLAATFVQSTSSDLDIPLSAINAGGHAPYHLINATVNLPSSRSPVLRDRRGDFFLFSKYWTGSAATGYAPTGEWKSNGKPLDLSTAMAISGAAASPYMGLGSLPTLSALMSFLNIRLGVWLGKPGTTAGAGVPGFLCLLREMTGVGMSEKGPWLNTSDGGHVENMGVYELLRRRCKFIVCVDGEADPQSTFHGQLTLVRHAQIDLGIRLEPKLDEIRPDPKSLYSRAHAHLFRVHYPPTADNCEESIGLMLYLKTSLTGDEAELLRRYRALHADFPHQSTLDQFYDEEQFEAYRQLGVHVASGMFSASLLTRNPRPNDVNDWFRQLAVNMLEPAD
jgi:hypothetical protein